MANKVSFIRENTHSCNWKYVPSDQNPPDIATRGKPLIMCKLRNVQKIVQNAEWAGNMCKLWPHGPNCISKLENKWPLQKN